MYEYKGNVYKVVDGDTVYILADLGFGTYRKIKIRIKGIDTAEIYSPSCEAELQHGREAKQFVKDEINNKNITFISYKDKTGKYGRYLGDISYIKNGESFLLTEELLKRGFQKKEIY